MSLFTCRIYLLKHDDLYVMASCYEYVHRTMCHKMDELRSVASFIDLAEMTFPYFCLKDNYVHVYV